MADVVVHPATGEVLDLGAASHEELGRWLLETRELEQQLRTEKLRVTQELLDRMDREASLTLRAGALEMKGDTKAPPTDYDAPALYQQLQEFVESEVITREALERAVEPVVVYKPRPIGIKALEKQGGSLAEVIAEHAKPREGYQRRVGVKERAV